MSSISSTSVSTLANPSQPSIENLALTNANTEYSQSLPTSTRKFFLQNRNDGKLKVAYTPGDSATKYITIWPGGSLFEEQIQGPVTLYIQSPKAGQTVEIGYWTL